MAIVHVMTSIATAPATVCTTIPCTGAERLLIACVASGSQRTYSNVTAVTRAPASHGNSLMNRFRACMMNTSLMSYGPGDDRRAHDFAAVRSADRASVNDPE